MLREGRSDRAVDDPAPAGRRVPAAELPRARARGPVAAVPLAQVLHERHRRRLERHRLAGGLQRQGVLVLELVLVLVLW